MESLDPSVLNFMFDKLYQQSLSEQPKPLQFKHRKKKSHYISDGNEGTYTQGLKRGDRHSLSHSWNTQTVLRQSYHDIQFSSKNNNSSLSYYKNHNFERRYHADDNLRMPDQPYLCSRSKNVPVGLEIKEHGRTAQNENRFSQPLRDSYRPGHSSTEKELVNYGFNILAESHGEKQKLTFKRKQAHHKSRRKFERFNACDHESYNSLEPATLEEEAHDNSTSDTDSVKSGVTDMEQRKRPVIDEKVKGFKRTNFPPDENKNFSEKNKSEHIVTDEYKVRNSNDVHKGTSIFVPRNNEYKSKSDLHNNRQRDKSQKYKEKISGKDSREQRRTKDKKDCQKTKQSFSDKKKPIKHDMQQNDGRKDCSRSTKDKISTEKCDRDGKRHGTFRRRSEKENRKSSYGKHHSEKNKLSEKSKSKDYPLSNGDRKLRSEKYKSHDRRHSHENYDDKSDSFNNRNYRPEKHMKTRGSVKLLKHQQKRAKELTSLEQTIQKKILEQHETNAGADNVYDCLYDLGDQMDLTFVETILPKTQTTEWSNGERQYHMLPINQSEQAFHNGGIWKSITK